MTAHDDDDVAFVLDRETGKFVPVAPKVVKPALKGAAKKAAKREAKRLVVMTQGDKGQKLQARTIWTKRTPRNPGECYNPTGKQFAK